MTTLTIDDVPILVRSAAIAEIIVLRHDVIIVGTARTSDAFDGDELPTTQHFGAFLDVSVIGCASYMQVPWQDEPAWQLRGMGVRADCQQRGVGTHLAVESERLLRQASPIHQLWCNARLSAVAFYERLGWQAVSDVFDVPEVGPHRRMVKSLT